MLTTRTSATRRGRPGLPAARRRGAPLVIPGALALALQLACRSAGGPPPVSAPGPLADAGRALVGQKRILRFHGLKQNLSLELGDLRPSGPCDVAVEVTSAVIAGGSARIALDVIGQPRPEARGPRTKKSPCRDLPAAISLALTGLRGDSAEKVAAEVGKVLLTAEGFLQTRGVRFDRSAAADPKEVADATLTAPPEEQGLARGITAAQKRLLAVDPVHRSANRKVHYEGQIEFMAVVGADGRLHRPRVTTSLGDYEQRVLRVLPLWRYEPALRGKELVAARITEKTILRIH